MKLNSIAVKVAEAVSVTGSVRRFTLIAADGGRLPGFSSGSHIRIAIETRGRRLLNAYSLLNSPNAADHYQIAVRKDAGGRGGSLFLHEQVRTGAILSIGHPANMFPLVATARKHLLIAGGIGITPIVSHLAALAYLGAAFELHFVVRSLDEGPFAGELAARYAGRVRLYRRDTRDAFDVAALLGNQPLGTHLYVCGPPRLIDAVTKAARAQGWPDRYVHLERFTQSAGGRPFTAVLARSGREIAVGATVSLLEALEDAGLEVPQLCRGGACGQCETGLLNGEAEHRDCFLGDAIRAAQTRIMPCVSRAKGDRLVLDL